MPEPAVTVLRADERYVTRSPGIVTRHCFSYGDHYDPDNVRFGPLRAVNDELLEPGAGYEPHRHADVEIVTWVLDGTLEHADSAGNQGMVRPGAVQYLSAGSGVEHTERNASEERPLRFVQMMVDPSAGALRSDPVPPVYVQHGLDGARGRWLRALTVRPGVVLDIALLDRHDTVALPEDEDLHLHVTRGSVVLGATGALRAGDTARLTSPPATALRAEQEAEVLLWHLDGTQE